MEKLYYDDTYMRSCMCTAVKVVHTDKATEVITDRTVFYPECGGQPGDRGMLGPYEVLDTRKADDGSSVLILGKDSDIAEGSCHELVLDWDHRYKYMVMHTAQHLLSGTLYNLFGIGTVAVHLGQDYLTIEVGQESVSESRIDEVVSSANRAIAEGHRIVYHEMSHSDAEALGLRRSIKVEGDVRIVEIEGVDRIACGGVHVADTSEIRLVCCTSHEQIRGHMRLYFACGQDALDCAIRNQKVTGRLNSLLSCRTDELEAKVAGLVSANAELKSARSALEKKLSVLELRANIDKDGICTMVLEEGSDIQGFAQAINACEDLALFVLCPDNGRTRWLIALKGKYGGIDFNSLRSTILARLSAKGGGRSPLFQGVAGCSDVSVLAECLEDFRRTVLGVGNR